MVLSTTGHSLLTKLYTNSANSAIQSGPTLYSSYDIPAFLGIIIMVTSRRVSHQLPQNPRLVRLCVPPTCALEAADYRDAGLSDGLQKLERGRAGDGLDGYIQWEIFRILKWRYVSTIFLAIFSGDIPLHKPKKRPYIW